MGHTSLRLPLSNSGGGGGSEVLATALGGKRYGSLRYFEIVSGTSGSLGASQPPNSTIKLDLFSEGADCIITEATASKPNGNHARTAGGAIITGTLDSDGDWTIDGTPSSYPIFLVYCVYQNFVDFDSTSPDILDYFEVNADFSYTNVGMPTVSTIQEALDDHEERLQTVIDDENETNSALATHEGLQDNPHETSDATLYFSDVTTNDASVFQHGFLKKLSDVATQFLNGKGNWVDPFFARTDVRVSTPTGYGSTGTVIPLWSVTHFSNNLTWVSDAVNGDYCVIAEDGDYLITFNPGSPSVSMNIGISINATSVSTNIQSLGYANGMVTSIFTPAGRGSDTTIPLTLSAGDVVRPHCGGGTLPNTELCWFSIKRTK